MKLPSPIRVCQEDVNAEIGDASSRQRDLQLSSAGAEQWKKIKVLLPPAPLYRVAAFFFPLKFDHFHSFLFLAPRGGKTT